MTTSGQAALYERLFLLKTGAWSRAEIVEQFRQEGVVHPLFANRRQQAIEDLRCDLSHVLTGLLHEREREACVKTVRKPTEPEGKTQD